MLRNILLPKQQEKIDKIIKKFVIDTNKVFDGDSLDGDETQDLADMVLCELNEFHANN